MDNVQKTHDYILSHWKQAIVLPKNAESPHMYGKALSSAVYRRTV